MLLQTLPLVAMIFLIGFGLLTSQLVAVRHSIQQASTRDLGLAVDGAVVDVTRVIAGYVRDNGTTEGPWKSPTEQSPKTSTCVANAPNQVCLYTTYRWRFTGASSSTPSFGGVSAGQSKAVNLQKALIDEQRVSIQINVAIDASKGDALATRTRDVTFRVFTASPYAVIVGSYDVTSALNNNEASQGDVGGNEQPVSKQLKYLNPDPQEPSDYRDTRIHVALTCQNSPRNADPIPQKDNQPAYSGVYAPNLPWGERDYAYETPCEPTYKLDPSPPGTPPYPLNRDYTLSEPSPTPETWNNGEETSASFAR